ncbi:radiation-inducible immediate-early gene IEX-1 [Clarias gariepinus]
MYSSRSTMSFTFPPSGAYRVLPRNTEPEVFTFDRLPDPQLSAPRQHQQQQQRRRVARVLYPAKVRKYLPPAEKSPAKRWLLALCLVLLAQIYTECDDELADITEAASRSDALSAELQGDAVSASSPLFLHFRSAEETARRLTSCSKAQGLWMNMSCSMEDEEVQEVQEQRHHIRQQMNNPYVVALLYPAVIHTLGSEQ